MENGVGVLQDPATCPNCTKLADRVNVSMPDKCFFKAWRDDSAPYDLDIEWWEVFACKLAFVLCFEVRSTKRGFVFTCSEDIRSME